MSYSKTDISELYVSIFNRASEGSGNLYWQSQNKSLAEIANDMLNTYDAKEYFGNSLNSNQAFIEHIYENTLNKTYSDDPEGIQYWTNALNNGVNRGEVVINMINAISTYAPGASNYNPNDSTTVAAYNQFIHRVEVSNYASDKVYNIVTGYKYKMGFNNLLRVNDSNESFNFGVKVVDGLIHSNSKELGEVSSLDDYEVEALDSGEYWDKQDITFGFNNTIPNAYYNNGSNLTNNWQPLNNTQRDLVREIVDDTNNYISISITDSSNPDIAFNIVDMENSVCGFTFYPGISVVSGDVFLSSKLNSDKDCIMSEDSYAYETAIHEFGHALGLKHPFDGSVTLSADKDDTNHTIMSYTDNQYKFIFEESGGKVSYTGSPITEKTFALYDIEALQAIYGANKSYNTGNNIFTQQFDTFSVKTIWDAGGEEDTLDFSLTTGTTILDMHSDTINSVDMKSLSELISFYQNEVSSSYAKDYVKDIITQYYNNNTIFTGKDNFSIVKGVVIENIISGSGNDIITDNEVDNKIYTNSGNDKIYLGSGGFDYIDGGDGYDIVYINANTDSSYSINYSNNSYILNNDNVSVVLTGVEEVKFLNDTIELG